MPLVSSKIQTSCVMLAVLLLAACATSAKPDIETSSSAISEANLERHVQYLANDELEGRGAGYAGEAMAAAYIAKEFEKMGLVAPAQDIKGWRAYLQPFAMHVIEGPVPWEIQKSQNVVGILPGTDLAHEYIVIGAHYDGQGKEGQAALGRIKPEGDAPQDDVVWNSAVDNAVSIASVLEIARVLTQSETFFRRSVVFVAFGAEESALNGSTFYANNPVGGRRATKAMINLEKIVGDADAEFLYVSYGTSEAFPEITDVVTGETGIALTAFYPGVIANTDHYAFILRGIPGITIGTGSVENVHLPSDHADGLDYALLRNRSRFIWRYLSEAANRDDDFAFTGNISGRLGASGGPATEQERRMREFDGETTFKVTSVVKGSPADMAGLVEGDMAIEINGAPLRRQDFYQGLEDVLGDEILCHDMSLTVRRGGSDVSVFMPANCNGDWSE